MNSPKSKPASYSTATVARRLGVSIPTVQRWVDLGHLVAWKTVGGHRKIDAASVEQFVSSRDLHAGELPPSGSEPIGPSVLVVDDNADDRDLFVALLEAALPGAVVSLASSGFEGLLCIGQATPDVLIADIIMPNMNGLEMLRHVAMESVTRPRIMIAVSSQTPEQLATLGGWPEGVTFLQKPIEVELLTSTLQALAVASGLRLA